MGSTIIESNLPGSDVDHDVVQKGRFEKFIGRITIFYIALIAAAAMTIMFLPDLLILLVMGWTSDVGTELGIHRLHVMGIAAVVTVFLIGLFAQAYQPRKRIAVIWGSLILIAIVSAGTVGFGVGRPEEVLPFLLVTAIAFASHPAGRDLFRRGERYSPALVALVLLAAIPILVFVMGQLSLSTNMLDPHAVDGHYVMMAALVLAPIVFGIFAAFGFPGWRLAGWLAALPMVYYGAMSIAFPLQSGSTGMMWGSLAILWAITFIAVVEYSRINDLPRLWRQNKAST